MCGVRAELHECIDSYQTSQQKVNQRFICADKLQILHSKGKVICLKVLVVLLLYNSFFPQCVMSQLYTVETGLLAHALMRSIAGLYTLIFENALIMQ